MRSRVVPAIREAFGDAGLRNIARSASQAQAAVDVAVRDRIDADLVEAQSAAGVVRGLSVEVLLHHELEWRQQLLLEATRRWLPSAPDRATIAEAIDGLLEARPGKKLVIDAGTVWRDRGAIVFLASEEQVDVQEVVKPGIPTRLTGGTLLVERLETTPDSIDVGDCHVELSDSRILEQPLTVGAWHSGERFQPLGMKGQKKISDFLTDAKVRPHLKAAVLVVRSGDEVVWVVGYRLAHQYRLRPDSVGAVKLSFTPTEPQPPSSSI